MICLSFASFSNIAQAGGGQGELLCHIDSFVAVAVITCSYCEICSLLKLFLLDSPRYILFL